MTVEMPLPLGNIQALVAAGFKDLPYGEYLLLSVNAGQAASARAWLQALLDADPKLIISIKTLAQREVRRQRLVTVAVSHAGLLALGLKPSQDKPFPSTFADGMGLPDRASLLGDNDAEAWRWADCAAEPSVDGLTEGNAQRQVVHLLVAHYWSDTSGGQNCPLFSAETLAAAGLQAWRVKVDRTQFRDGKMFEPFGFRDGVAQPTIAGLRAELDSKYDDADGERRAALKRNRSAAGEFLLGQENEYREPAYAPDVENYAGPDTFAYAGSYIAVRQIRQHVAAFKAVEAKYAKQAPPRHGGPSIGERMIGRRTDGTPLCPFNASDIDDFGYFTTDQQGYGCPRGAHIRRANPRDSLGHDAKAGEEGARLHRLLRRGRAYVEGDERGLFFMALNADLDRQFAFIQRRWIANSHFSGLAGEGDPLLGQAQRAFTIQDPWVSERVTGLPRFTSVVGGGYFLLPSLSALRYMAQGGAIAPAYTCPHV